MDALVVAGFGGGPGNPQPAPGLFPQSRFRGVEITPIYGVQGNENRNIPNLSPAWQEMLRHTVSEAKGLGMEVDLPLGSGGGSGESLLPMPMRPRNSLW